MVLLNMSLENTLITAQSMQARGYGLGRKTNANRRSVRWQEIVFLGTAVCCLVLSLALGGSLFFEANYFPSLNFGQPSLQTAMGALCLAVGLNLPMVYNGWEEAAWHYYRSKI